MSRFYDDWQAPPKAGDRTTTQGNGNGAPAGPPPTAPSNPCAGGLVPSARRHPGLDGTQCVEKEDDCAPNWGAITIKGGETICQPNSTLYGGSSGGGSGGGGAAVAPFQWSDSQLAQLGFISDTARLLGGQGKALFDIGLPAYKAATSYYQAILGGDKAAAARAAGPAMEGIASSYGGAIKGLETSGLRGGALDQAKADLLRSEAGQIGGLVAGQQPAAANALLSGGLAGSQLGTGVEGTGGQLGATGLSIDVGAMLQDKGLNIQSQLGNRGLDIQSQLGNRGLDIQQMLGLKSLDLQSSQFQQQFAFQSGPAFQLQQDYLNAYLSQLANQANAAKGAKNGQMVGGGIAGVATIAAALI